MAKRKSDKQLSEKEKKDKDAAKQMRHSGLSSQEIMDAIIDKDALAKRKSVYQSKATKTKHILQTVKEEYWWQQPINIEDFIIAEFNGKFCARLKCWKNNIWIGEYNSNEELMTVLTDYCKSTKNKGKFKKTIPNLHSIVK